MVAMKCPICQTEIINNICNECGWTRSDDADYDPECPVCVKE